MEKYMRNEYCVTKNVFNPITTNSYMIEFSRMSRDIVDMVDIMRR